MAGIAAHSALACPEVLADEDTGSVETRGLKLADGVAAQDALASLFGEIDDEAPRSTARQSLAHAHAAPLRVL